MGRASRRRWLSRSAVVALDLTTREFVAKSYSEWFDQGGTGPWRFSRENGLMTVEEFVAELFHAEGAALLSVAESIEANVSGDDHE